MRIVGIITGILGSVALFGGGLFILLLGGVGQGLGAMTDDAQYAQEFEQVGTRGIYLILISILAFMTKQESSTLIRVFTDTTKIM